MSRLHEECKKTVVFGILYSLNVSEGGFVLSLNVGVRFANCNSGTLHIATALIFKVSWKRRREGTMEDPAVALIRSVSQAINKTQRNSQDIQKCVKPPPPPPHRARQFHQSLVPHKVKNSVFLKLMCLNLLRFLEKGMRLLDYGKKNFPLRD